MKYYVYILQNEVDGTFYKRYTSNYLHRLEEHNSGLSRYTSKKIPWKLVYVEICDSKRDALIREKSLKQANSDYLVWLICQSSNLIHP